MFLVPTLILLLLTIATIPNTSYRLGSLFREVIQEEVMMKRYLGWIFAVTLFFLSFLSFTLLHPSEAKTPPPQQYPILDKIANKIILKYQQSSCEQLQQKESQKAPPSPEEIRAVQFLHSDAQMRVYFINKVAPPIANKLFDCGMIP